MKTILALLSLSFAFLTVACLPMKEDAMNSQSEGEETEIEKRERDPIAATCRVLAYSSLRSILSEALEIPDDALLYNGMSLQAYLTANQNSLGGEGASEVRECSLTYLKAVSLLAVYACHWTAQNNLSLIFPQSTLEVSTVFQLLTGLNPDSTEIAALQEVSGSIVSFDNAAFNSIHSKRAAAICTAVFTSMATQTI